MTNSQLLERPTKILSKHCIKREKHQKVNFEKLLAKVFNQFSKPTRPIRFTAVLVVSYLLCY